MDYHHFVASSELTNQDIEFQRPLASQNRGTSRQGALPDERTQHPPTSQLRRSTFCFLPRNLRHPRPHCETPHRTCYPGLCNSKRRLQEDPQYKRLMGCVDFLFKGKDHTRKSTVTVGDKGKYGNHYLAERTILLWRMEAVTGTGFRRLLTDAAGHSVSPVSFPVSAFYFTKGRL